MSASTHDSQSERKYAVVRKLEFPQIAQGSTGGGGEAYWLHSQKHAGPFQRNGEAQTVPGGTGACSLSGEREGGGTITPEPFLTAVPFIDSEPNFHNNQRLHSGKHSAHRHAVPGL